MFNISLLSDHTAAPAYAPIEARLSCNQPAPLTASISIAVNSLIIILLIILCSYLKLIRAGIVPI